MSSCLFAQPDVGTDYDDGTSGAVHIWVRESFELL